MPGFQGRNASRSYAQENKKAAIKTLETLVLHFLAWQTIRHESDQCKGDAICNLANCNDKTSCHRASQSAKDPWVILPAKGIYSCRCMPYIRRPHHQRCPGKKSCLSPLHMQRSVFPSSWYVRRDRWSGIWETPLCEVWSHQH